MIEEGFSNWFHKKITKRPLVVRSYNVYQRTMWYMAQSGNEVGKPLRFVKEGMDVANFITIQTGVVIGVGLTLGFIGGVSLFAILLGVLFVSAGVVRYNLKLSNNHNAELQEVLINTRELIKKFNEGGLNGNTKEEGKH